MRAKTLQIVWHAKEPVYSGAKCFRAAEKVWGTLLHAVCPK